MVVDVSRAKSLGRLRELVSADTKLTKTGNEFEGLCPFHKEKSPSFRVFPGRDNNERYHCFGCGVDGDVLDYVMLRYSVSFQEAGKIIAGEDLPVGQRPQPRPASEPHDPYKGMKAIVPIPKGTEPINPGERVKIWNPKRGKFTNYVPTSVHLYRTADGGGYGYVLRQDLDNGRKVTPMVQWCSRPDKPDGWSHFTFARPRPMYGIGHIAEKKQIVIVEGEKTADHAYGILGTKTAVVCWAGGTNAPEHTDWSPLSGRDVIIVPDADEPGRAAADAIALLADEAGALRIRIVDTSEMEATKKGWDLVDADPKWGRPDVMKWLGERAQGWSQPDDEGEPMTAEEGQPPTEPEETGTDVAETENWEDIILYNADGAPKASSQHNYITFLRHHPDFRGIFHFNEFSLQITLTKCPPWEKERDFKVRDLTEEDTIFCQSALERYGLTPKFDGARKAIIAAASKNAFHPAREFFTALRDKWDGEKRLDNWLTYYLGAKPTAFTAMVGRKWMVAAVRRVFQPGCKFDSMLILEGPQNIGKSFALRELATFHGESYFTDGVKDIRAKEAAMTMHGCLIVELAELDALSKAETTQIKSWITQQEDSYRPPYASQVRRAPRQCVLAGTVNPEGGYLKDSTGNRRFWPVWCTAVDLPAIKADREQIWAEAVNAHFAGEAIYLQGDEIKIANAAQADRYQDDIWADDIDNFIAPMGSITVREILWSVLEIPKERRSVLQERRVMRHLINRGWMRVKDKGDDLITSKDITTWAFISPAEQRVRGV